VEPGTKINIVIPPVNSDDPAEKAARETFESFSPEMQKALQSGSLDEVNKVLADINVEEAEAIVGKLGEVYILSIPLTYSIPRDANADNQKGGMLSLEEQIIDATTEEGQEALKRFDEMEKQKVKETVAQTEDPE
jgi:cell division cycle protein 37